MDGTENYDDPFRAAYGDSTRRLAELASIVATGAYLWGNQVRQRRAEQALRDEAQARRTREQRLLAQNEARSQWARALDPEWLRHADLPDTARVWGAAMPYAADADALADHARQAAERARRMGGHRTQAARDAHWAAEHADADAKLAAEAADAMRRAESRLRVLHPHAMSHYDRLREAGFHPAEAMEYAVPFFARDPRTHAQGPAPGRAALNRGPANAQPWPAPTHGPSREEFDSWRAEERCRRIIEELQAQALAAGRGQLGDSELRVLLEQRTNASEDIIDAAIARERRRRAAADGIALSEDMLADTAERDRAHHLGDAIDNAATPVVDEATQNLAAAQPETGAAAAARARAAAARNAVARSSLDFPQGVDRVVQDARTGTNKQTAISKARVAREPRPARGPHRR